MQRAAILGKEDLAATDATGIQVETGSQKIKMVSKADAVKKQKEHYFTIPTFHLAHFDSECGTSNPITSTMAEISYFREQIL